MVWAGLGWCSSTEPAQSRDFSRLKRFRQAIPQRFKFAHPSAVSRGSRNRSPSSKPRNFVSRVWWYEHVSNKNHDFFRRSKACGDRVDFGSFTPRCSGSPCRLADSGRSHHRMNLRCSAFLIQVPDIAVVLFSNLLGRDVFRRVADQPRHVWTTGHRTILGRLLWITRPQAQKCQYKCDRKHQPENHNHFVSLED
jgi:hypothetical protein